MERRIRFELLYARQAPLVKAYLLRRGAGANADDAVAEVFLACWRRLDELPPDPLPWLLGAARKTLSTQRRGERRRSALGERLAETAIAGGHDPIAALADHALGVALARVSVSDRELLLLIAWEGLTPAQAARSLGIKPATARVRLARARRRMARRLPRRRPLSPAPGRRVAARRLPRAGVRRSRKRDHQLPPGRPGRGWAAYRRGA